MKNLYLRFDRSYARKAVELVLALEAERKLGKDEILELYLNVIYFGNGVYGIGDAARFHFGREPQLPQPYNRTQPLCRGAPWLRQKEGNMDFKDLTEEQKAKARACKTPEELHALARQEGVELSLEELDGVAGGWGCSNDQCPEDCQFRSCGTYLT